MLKEIYLKLILKIKFDDNSKKSISCNNYLIEIQDVSSELLEFSNEVLAISFKYNYFDLFNVLLEICDIYKLIKFKFKYLQTLYTFFQYYYDQWHGNINDIFMTQYSDVIINLSGNNIESNLKILFHKIFYALIKLNQPETFFQFLNCLLAKKSIDIDWNSNLKQLNESNMEFINKGFDSSQEYSIDNYDLNNFELITSDNSYLIEYLANAYFLKNDKVMAIKYYKIFFNITNVDSNQMNCNLNFQHFYYKYFDFLIAKSSNYNQFSSDFFAMQNELELLVIKYFRGK